MNNPFDFFDRIYCISMDENSFRWKMAVKQLKLLGIYDRTERIQGVKNGENITGCFLSHQLCVRKAKGEGVKNIFIFEDDFCMLSRDMKHLLDSLENLKKHDWELFYLGGKIEEKLEDIEENLCSVKLWFTHAYAINGNAFDKILAFKGDDSTFRGHSKGQIDVFYFLNDFKMYLINPMMAIQVQDDKEVRPHWQMRSFMNKIL
jgi:GR25 family glycosyltransferase involved in LPS biosynthesis